MAAKIFTALTFRGKTLDELKFELKGFSSELYDFATGLARIYAARPTVSQLNPSALAFGRLHKFSLNFGEIIDVQLPRPDPLNGGLMIHIARATATGTIVVHAVEGSLLNGRSSLRIPAAPGYYMIGFDSEDYFSSPALAMDWGDGLP